LLSVLVGLLARRDILALLFGSLSLFYVGYTSYPLARTLFTGFDAGYAMERFSFCAMLLAAMLLAVRVSGLPKKWGAPFVGFGFLMCAVSAVFHLLLPVASLGMMLAYSWLVSVAEWIAAGAIAGAVLYAVRKRAEHITPLLYGVAILVCALAMDRLLPLYEPILTGWFIELASFALVLSVGVVTGQDVAGRYRESAVMTERANSLERLYQSQRSPFETLNLEVNQPKTLRHDMRHHIAAMDEYLQSRQYDKLGEYMTEYRYALAGGELPEYCPIDVINILTRHFHAAARRSGIHLEIRCDLTASEEPGRTAMSNIDLCCLYSNIMENALEACLRISAGKRAVRAAIIRLAPDILDIRVLNTAAGVWQAGGRFLSSKQKGRSYGLSSIEAIAAKYEGKAEFRWNAERMEFDSHITVRA
jgi:hypothetical protein